MWELDYKESWAPKNWCFWTVVLEKTLESLLDCKGIKSVNPKGTQKESEVAQSCPILCNPIDYKLPCSSFHGIFQARILEWVAISFSRGSSWPRGQTWVSCIARQILYYWANWEALVGTWKVKVAQLCPTLCNPMDYIVYGILQARILEWVDFPFSRGSSQPRDRTQVSCIADGFFTSWATREASIGM